MFKPCWDMKLLFKPSSTTSRSHQPSPLSRGTKVSGNATEAICKPEAKSTWRREVPNDKIKSEVCILICKPDPDPSHSMKIRIAWFFPQTRDKSVRNSREPIQKWLKKWSKKDWVPNQRATSRKLRHFSFVVLKNVEGIAQHCSRFWKRTIQSAQEIALPSSQFRLSALEDFQKWLHKCVTFKRITKHINNVLQSMFWGFGWFLVRLQAPVGPPRAKLTARGEDIAAVLPNSKATSKNIKKHQSFKNVVVFSKSSSSDSGLSQLKQTPTLQKSVVFSQAELLASPSQRHLALEEVKAFSRNPVVAQLHALWLVCCRGFSNQLTLVSFLRAQASGTEIHETSQNLHGEMAIELSERTMHSLNSVLSWGIVGSNLLRFTFLLHWIDML